MKQKFKLPSITNFKIDSVEKDLWFDKIKFAQNIMTFIKSSDNDYECYFSAIGIEELGMLLVLFDRYPEVYDFFYAAVVNIELYKNDNLEGFNYTVALEDNLKNKKII